MKFEMLRKSLFFSILLTMGILFNSKINAQCSLCTTSVENGVKSTTKKAGLGLNNGIYVLLTLPYALVTVIGIIWYTNTHSKKRGRVTMQQ